MKARLYALYEGGYKLRFAVCLRRLCPNISRQIWSSVYEDPHRNTLDFTSLSDDSVAPRLTATWV